MCNMAGVLSEAGTALPLRVPGLTPVFDEVCGADHFSFLCCVLFVFVLCLVLPVSGPFLIVSSVFSNVYFQKYPCYNITDSFSWCIH